MSIFKGHHLHAAVSPGQVGYSISAGARFSPGVDSVLFAHGCSRPSCGDI